MASILQEHVDGQQEQQQQQQQQLARKRNIDCNWIMN